MGYIITYPNCASGRSAEPSHRSHLLRWTFGFFLAFLLLTKLYWPEGSAKLRNMLIPGDPEVTGHAVMALLDDLRTGEPLEIAVKTFCNEILTHAENPD